MSYEKRRNLLTDRPFQIRLVMKLVALGCGTFLGLAALTILFPGLSAWISGNADWSLASQALTSKTLWLSTIIPGLAAAGVMMWVGIRVTHRFVGPHYRFRTVLQKLSELEVPRGLTIRKDDYVQDTAAAFNQCLVTLHDHVAHMKRLDARLLEQGMLVDDEARAVLSPVLEELHQAIDKFRLCTQSPGCEPVDPLVESAEVLPALEQPVVEPLEEVAASSSKD